MKIFSALVVLLGVLIFSPLSYAQNDKFGENPELCKNDLTEYISLFKEKKYTEALPKWRRVFNQCPQASQKTYLCGEKIMIFQLRNAEEAQKRRYVDTLEMINLQRLEYFPTYKGKSQKGKIYGYIGVSMYKYDPDRLSKAYDYLKESVDLEQNNASNGSMIYLFRASLKKYENGNLSIDIINDTYKKLAGYINTNIENKKDNQAQLKKWQNTLKNLDNQFVEFSKKNNLPTPDIDKSGLLVQSNPVLPNKTKINGKEKIGLYNGVACDQKDKNIYLKWEFNAKSGELKISANIFTETIGKSTHFRGSLGYVEINGNINMSKKMYRSTLKLNISEKSADAITISKVQYNIDYGTKNSRGYREKKPVFFNTNILIDLKPMKESIRYEKAKNAFEKAKNASVQDCISYLKTNPNEQYKEYIENDFINKCKSIEDILSVITYNPKLNASLENIFYSLVKDSKNPNDCDKYTTYYPTGKYTTEVNNYKRELNTYQACQNGTIADCNTYLTSYPKGKFITDVQSIKAEKNRIAERNKQIKTNSNKSGWYLGNRLCYADYNGIILASLDQWNENKSMFKGKIVASPGGLFEGEILQKGNMLWIDPQGWHKCLEDENDYAIRNDRSLEAEKLLLNKNKKFDIGTKVCKISESSGIFFSYTRKIIGMVEEWNSDFSKMKLRISDDGGYSKYNDQGLYQGATIWATPIGWQKCN